MQIGLVFSGGGGKGAYEIGVWRALRPWGWKIWFLWSPGLQWEH